MFWEVLSVGYQRLHMQIIIYYVFYQIISIWCFRVCFIRNEIRINSKKIFLCYWLEKHFFSRFIRDDSLNYIFYPLPVKVPVFHTVKMLQMKKDLKTLSFKKKSHQNLGFNLISLKEIVQRLKLLCSIPLKTI